MSEESGKAVPRSRAIAEELAKKRAAQAEALGASNAGESGSLAGVGVVAGFGLVGLGAFFAFSEEGQRWFDQNLFRGTVLEEGYKFVKSQVGESVKSFTDPISDALLPDFTPEQVPPGTTPPRTLVLDFEDTLCHLEWDRKNGWRAVKRPGVDQFLRRVYQFYEVVLFTTGHRMFLEPFVMSLDPMFIMGNRLYREASIYEEGEYVKDLGPLNRDIKRVVVVDDQPKCVAKHPDNVIAIKPFTDPHSPDTALMDLVPFLEDLVMRDVPDVRTEIAKYKGKDVASEFRREQQERAKQLANQRKGTLGAAIQGGLRGAVGVAPAAPMPAPAPTSEMPMTTLQEAATLKAIKAEPIPAEIAEAKPKVGSFWGSLVK